MLISFSLLIINHKNNLKKAIVSKESLNFSYDILNPKFTINNTNQNIAVSANEGNFIDTNEVLLQNNVKFKSKNFLIESSEVFFNRKNQSAFSNKNSKFLSTKTSINAEGFN